MCRSSPASENKKGQSKQRKQKVQRHKSREERRIWGKGRKIKHRVWGGAVGGEDIKTVWGEVVENFEYQVEESGLDCGENGELLKVSEERRDSKAYSISSLRL